MENLIWQFNQIAKLSMPLEDHLRAVIRKREIRRKELLLREGETARDIYFVESGLVRSYYWKEHKEICNWFMRENDVFVSVQSFFFQEPSYEAHEAMEDSILWGISFEQLQFIYKTFPEFNFHRGVILERYYALSEKRHFITRKVSMLKRYENLLSFEPHLIGRVPNKYLASYLGMTETTFSHIRNEYAKLLRSGGGKHASDRG